MIDSDDDIYDDDDNIYDDDDDGGNNLLDSYMLLSCTVGTYNPECEQGET